MQESLYTHLPTCPGVYLMKNDDGKIVYIGKSKNLRARVRSYFMPGAELNFAKKKMVKIVHSIDYIETKTDLEALMLETNLIKKNQPKYNVLMKDGKNLSYLKITSDETPLLVRTRLKTREKGAQYFGPYSQYFDSYRYARFVRKLFRLGNHTTQRELLTGKPCMDTYLGICPGHCTGDADKIQLYLDRLNQAREFLEGKHDIILAELRSQMQDAAQSREYERAGEYKSMIEQIEATGNRQIVRDLIEGDGYVVVALEKYGQTFLGIVDIRRGMITGVHEYTLANPLDEGMSDLVSEAFSQYLSEKLDQHTVTVYTDIDLESSESYESYGRGLNIHHPKRGEKVRLLEFAHTNLLNFAYRETMETFKKATLGKKEMVSLLERLFGMKNEKGKMKNEGKEIVFECFDISHSHGEHTVASKSVLVNGKPDPKRYKKYRIKTLKTGEIDDFASMEEILTRRTLAALRGEDPWPDLIVIDGGKGQLSHALKAIQNTQYRMKNEGGRMKDDGMKCQESDGEIMITGNLEPRTYDLQPLPPRIISLAKQEEEVFLPGRSEPVLLEKGSLELMLLQKIRDEAHRFAINYNRVSREKSYTKTLLDEIPGIGPSTRKKILSTVSRIEDLQSWSYERAQEEFGKKAADTLEAHGVIGGESGGEK